MKPTHVIYGGAFDPPHSGHVESVAAVRKLYPNRHIWIMPGQKPAVVSGRHKVPAASFEHRLAMCHLAFANDPMIEISCFESQLPPPVYTIDTLIHLKKAYPEAIWAVLIGQDQLRNFPYWHKPKEVLQHAQLMVVRRQMVEDSSLGNNTRLADDTEKTRLLMEMKLSWKQRDHFAEIIDLDSGIELIDISVPPAESRLIREEPESQRSDAWLPDAIKAYITQHRLYSGVS